MLYTETLLLGHPVWKGRCSSLNVWVPGHAHREHPEYHSRYTSTHITTHLLPLILARTMHQWPTVTILLRRRKKHPTSQQNRQKAVFVRDTNHVFVYLLLTVLHYTTIHKSVIVSSRSSDVDFGVPLSFLLYFFLHPTNS